MSAIIYFIVLAAFYGIFYYFNHMTPKPKGCEKIDIGCEGCQITSCLKHPSHEYEKIKGANNND